MNAHRHLIFEHFCILIAQIYCCTSLVVPSSCLNWISFLTWGYLGLMKYMSLKARALFWGQERHGLTTAIAQEQELSVLPFKETLTCIRPCASLATKMACVVSFLSSVWNNSSLHYPFPRSCPDWSLLSIWTAKKQGQGKLRFWDGEQARRNWASFIQ